MPCLNDEYAREKAENAKNEVRDKGARKQGAKRMAKRTVNGGGCATCAPPVAHIFPCAGGFGVWGEARRGDGVTG